MRPARRFTLYIGEDPMTLQTLQTDLIYVFLSRLRARQ